MHRYRSLKKDAQWWHERITTETNAAFFCEVSLGLLCLGQPVGVRPQITLTKIQSTVQKGLVADKKSGKENKVPGSAVMLPNMEKTSFVYATDIKMSRIQTKHPECLPRCGWEIEILHRLLQLHFEFPFFNIFQLQKEDVGFIYMSP